MNTSLLRQYAAPLLRISMALVFLWFGASQVLSPMRWVSYIPEFLISFGLSDVVLVYINGVFEIIASLLLVVGVGVTPVAAMLSIHLFGIACTIGFTAVGIRDFGLALATAAVAFYGKDSCCLWKRKKNTVVICDLDGTLADCEHRRHFVTGEKKYFDEFYDACDQDGLNPAVQMVLKQAYESGTKVYLFSGRSARVRDKTMMWLRQHHVCYHDLVMRPEENTEPDDVLKERWLHERFSDLSQIAFVIDDRQKVVDMWRKNGLTCMQVAPGQF